MSHNIIRVLCTRMHIRFDLTFIFLRGQGHAINDYKQLVIYKFIA